MKFVVEVEVKQVTGSQLFEIEAESNSEARAAVCRGEGTWVEDRLQVEALKWGTAQATEIES